MWVTSPSRCMKMGYKWESMSKSSGLTYNVDIFLELQCDMTGASQTTRWRNTDTKSTYTKQGEFFPDFSILWIGSVRSSSLSATDNQILIRGAATRYFPRYLTYCFVRSSVVGNGKGSRESNWKGALRINLSFCRHVSSRALTFSPGFCSDYLWKQ